MASLATSVFFQLFPHAFWTESGSIINFYFITSDGIQNFKNRFSFVSNPLTTVSVLRFKVLRTGSKLGCSLKKKGLHFNFISNFSFFLPKLGCSLKKKKKVFTQNRSLHSEQTSAVD